MGNRIPTIEQYLIQQMTEMGILEPDTASEYKTVMDWMKQYCEMVIDQCADSARQEYESFDKSWWINKESITDVKKML